MKDWLIWPRHVIFRGHAAGAASLRWELPSTKSKELAMEVAREADTARLVILVRQGDADAYDCTRCRQIRDVGCVRSASLRALLERTTAGEMWTLLTSRLSEISNLVFFTRKF